MLALLLLHPEKSTHVREIARAIGKAPGTLLRELNALAAREPFLGRVLAERKIFIVGGEDDLGKPAAHRKAEGARRR